MDKLFPRSPRQTGKPLGQGWVGLSTGGFVVGNELLQVASHLFGCRLALECRQSSDGIQLVSELDIPLARFACLALGVFVRSLENSHGLLPFSLSQLAGGNIQVQ